MKTIIINEMHITNFKGVRDLTITFNEDVTNIFGRNGSGKTTVFDAFTWLLFGKDSSDRKAFDLKTLDEDGNIIPQLPHEVSATITVNGQDVRLMRRFTEKWVKRAGKVEKEFTGNQEERFFNDVPCSKKEYEEKIADICREDIFKFITSPTYFTAQKADAQKAMLQQMAGNITDEEVAAGNADFEALLDAITGKSLTEFKKEIGAKKQRINAELLDLPGRIDEKKRDIATEADSEDWSEVERELAQKREARAHIEAKIDDIAALQRADDAQRKGIEAKINELRSQLFAVESEIRQSVTRDYYEAQHKQNALTQERHNLQSQIASRNQDIAHYQREIGVCASTRENLLSEYRALNAQLKAVQAEELIIDEAQFVCPTCHRPLDSDDIDMKVAELRKNFETERGKRLEAIAADIDRNKRSGIANNDRKQYYEQQVAEIQQSVDNMKQRIEAIEATADYSAHLVEPDATEAIAADSRVQELQQRIEELQKQLENIGTQTEDTTELKEGRSMLSSAIEELVGRLAKRDEVASKRKEAQKRIEELEKKMQKLNIELAELERQEFVIAEFSKARNAAVEARINGLFSVVRFRWLAVAINGAESETCEATINGVPYSSLNHAGQITAGLDIINAICKSQDICAPIFIDNAESINDIIPMQSQIINLIVSRDAQLRVEANK